MKDLIIQDIQLFALCAVIGIFLFFGLYIDPAAALYFLSALVFIVVLQTDAIRFPEVVGCLKHTSCLGFTRQLTLQRVDPLLC